MQWKKPSLKWLSVNTNVNILDMLRWLN
jgi:hypothetical protein